MTSNDLPQKPNDYPKQIWNLATQFSSGAQSAAARKVRESGFDESQGLIPFEETLINLSALRDVLLDTVERGKLTQLPLRLQSRIFQEMTRVATTLSELSQGKDTIRLLENSVEDLNATVYQLNLQNQSESILGFERKMNELKSEEVVVKRSLKRALHLETRLDEVDKIINQLQGYEIEAKSKLAISEESASHLKEVYESIQSLETKAKTSLTIITEYQQTITKATALAQSNLTELSEAAKLVGAEQTDIAELQAEHTTLVKAMAELQETTKETVEEQLNLLTSTQAVLKATLLESSNALAIELRETIQHDSSKTHDDLIELYDKSQSKLSDFMVEAHQAEASRVTEAKDQLEEQERVFEEHILESKQMSTEILDEHKESTTLIVDRLRQIEEQIDGAILRATGYTLFHSFQKRQEDLKKSSTLWAYVLAGCIILSTIASITFLFFLRYFPSSGPAIYFKISLSLPLIAAITFCGWQYTRERRLEEEYAFKSNISISLKPYQELVESLVDKDDPEERAKYTAFIIASINKVFTSPTGLVFDTEKMPGDEAKELLKATFEGAKDIIKAKSGS